MNWVIWVALGESTMALVLLALIYRAVRRPTVKMRTPGTGFSGEITVSPVGSAFRFPKDFNPKHCDHVGREMAKLRATEQERRS